MQSKQTHNSFSFQNRLLLLGKQIKRKRNKGKFYLSLFYYFISKNAISLLVYSKILPSIFPPLAVLFCFAQLRIRVDLHIQWRQKGMRAMARRGVGEKRCAFVYVRKASSRKNSTQRGEDFMKR